MKIGTIIQIWYGAIAIYNTALKFAPNDLKTLKRKGFALEKLSELQLSQQQYTEAIKALKQAIALVPFLDTTVMQLISVITE